MTFDQLQEEHQYSLMFGASVFESFQTKILVTGASNHKE